MSEPANLDAIEARRRAIFEARDEILVRQGIRGADDFPAVDGTMQSFAGEHFGGGTLSAVLVNFDERLGALESTSRKLCPAGSAKSRKPFAGYVLGPGGHMIAPDGETINIEGWAEASDLVRERGWEWEAFTDRQEAVSAVTKRNKPNIDV